MMSQLTWYLKVKVTSAAHSGDGGSLALPGDALLHPTFSKHFDREWTSCLHTTTYVLSTHKQTGRLISGLYLGRADQQT